MATNDGHVQVALDGAGKKIDNSVLTREPTTPGATGEIVYRQRTVIGSDEHPNLQASVEGEKGHASLSVEAKNLDDIWEKLDEITNLLRLVLGG